MQTSNSVQPPLIFSANSGPPTSSAPAALASSILSPLAKTITRSVLPMPWGSTIEPRTNWSACLGSIPSRIDDLDRLVELGGIEGLQQIDRLGQRQAASLPPAAWPAWPSCVSRLLAFAYFSRSPAANKSPPTLEVMSSAWSASSGLLIAECRTSSTSLTRSLPIPCSARCRQSAGGRPQGWRNSDRSASA